MEARPSALDDYLFDLRGYLVIEKAVGPDLLARLNRAFDEFPPLQSGQWWGNAQRRDYTDTTGFELHNCVEAGEPFEELIDCPGWIDYVRHYCGEEQSYVPGLFIDECIASRRSSGGHHPAHSGGYKAAIELDDETDARYNQPDDAGKRKQPSERFKVGDIVEAIGAGGNALKHAEHRALFAPGAQGAVVVIDVRTRKVRALVGGYNTRVGGLDRATQAKRQPGSSFKTFVYATGIASRKFTAATKVNDTPDVLNNVWKPKNYDKKFVGPVLVRYALSKSINTISIRITHDVTP